MLREPCVYILADQNNETLYIGVTSSLRARVKQHLKKLQPGVTACHALNRLVWFEIHETMDSAVDRERQLKAGGRQQQQELINDLNPRWQDLYLSLL